MPRSAQLQIGNGWRKASSSRPADLRGNTKATVVTDYMQVVNKYKDSEDVLIVGGGAVVWELFLPYADEIVIAKSFMTTKWAYQVLIAIV
ncbi:hypothetical protein [Vibrio sp. SCSIO 43137]|uniref:hypothetical protein n=1 Tax=Vibrio sp. SCSIO 43137 TaxID=3021011 RepID=UPI0023078F89|nr:hypothetical protein [Vibrio sp. SCSIO 43137]WCE31580.1 hypothetical protein PK654_20860 [Vibrio sp. SCSIO 43137]